MNEMNLRISWWRSAGRMNVKASKVFHILESLLNGKISKVLIPESDDLFLCDKKSQFILASVIKLRELDACDLCTDRGCDVFDFTAGFQQVLEAWICILAVLVVLERLQWFVSEEVVR